MEGLIRHHPSTGIDWQSPSCLFEICVASGESDQPLSTRSDPRRASDDGFEALSRTHASWVCQRAHRLRAAAAGHQGRRVCRRPVRMDAAAE